MEKRPLNYKQIETILAIIISILLLGSLLSQTYFDFPYQITSAILLVFLLTKVTRVISNKGTIIDEYVSIGLLTIFWIVHLIIQTLHPFIIIVVAIILLHSIGLAPKLSKMIKSRSVGSFIASYAFFVLTIIALFAGAYSSNASLFTQENLPTTLSFEEALYFSTITFTTIGYGDIAPIGINRLIASIESLTAAVLNIAFIGYILASRKILQDPTKIKP